MENSPEIRDEVRLRRIVWVGMPLITLLLYLVTGSVMDSVIFAMTTVLGPLGIVVYLFPLWVAGPLTVGVCILIPGKFKQARKPLMVLLIWFAVGIAIFAMMRSFAHS